MNYAIVSIYDPEDGVHELLMTGDAAGDSEIHELLLGNAFQKKVNTRCDIDDSNQGAKFGITQGNQ